MLFFRGPSQMPLASRAAATSLASSCRPHSSLPVLPSSLSDCTSKPPAQHKLLNQKYTNSTTVLQCTSHHETSIIHVSAPFETTAQYSVLHHITSFSTMGFIPLCFFVTQQQAHCPPLPDTQQQGTAPSLNVGLRPTPPCCTLLRCVSRQLQLLSTQFDAVHSMQATHKQKPGKVHTSWASGHTSFH